MSRDMSDVSPGTYVLRPDTSSGTPQRPRDSGPLAVWSRFGPRKGGTPATVWRPGTTRRRLRSVCIRRPGSSSDVPRFSPVLSRRPSAVGSLGPRKRFCVGSWWFRHRISRRLDPRDVGRVVLPLLARPQPALGIGGGMPLGIGGGMRRGVRVRFWLDGRDGGCQRGSTCVDLRVARLDRGDFRRRPRSWQRIA